MGAYKQIPADTFERLQMDAGMICSSFDPTTGTAGDIIGATTGGIQIDATPDFSDMGEDVDNCPTNMLELKKLNSWECKISGTYLTMSASALKSLIGAAAVNSNHITLKNKLETSDFQTLWFVGDYGKAGYLAVKLSNAFNTSGLSLKTEKDSKGQVSFEYLGHYSINAQNVVPLEIYISDSVTTYPITYNLSNTIATIKPTDVASGSDIVSRFSAEADYNLPDTVTVKVGGTAKTVDTDYTWDKTSGLLYIKSSAVTGDVEISIESIAG